MKGNMTVCAAPMITDRKLMAWARQRLPWKPPQAYDRVVQMGSAAQWFFKTDVLALANEHCRQLHGIDLIAETLAIPHLSCGDCVILLALPLGRGDDSPFRSATIWPLRWQQDTNHHPILPSPLKQQADRVIQVLLDSKYLKSQNWGLRFSFDDWSKHLDLSDLPGSFDSAFFALAVGLTLAENGIIPKRDVIVTAGWNENSGAAPVDELQEKLRLAQQLGVTKVYLPDQCMEQADQICDSLGGPHPELRQMPMATPRSGAAFRDLLVPILEELALPPDRHAPKNARTFYFLTIPDHSAARRYYRSRIRDDVIERLSSTIHKQFSKPFTYFVSIASASFDLSVILARAVNPQHVMLLYDSSNATEAEEIVRELRGLHGSTSVEVKGFVDEQYDDLRAKFLYYVREFLGDGNPEHLVIDVTSGKTVWKFALHNAAPPNAMALCCQSQFDPKTRRPIPFTEELYFWRIGRCSELTFGEL